MFSGLGFSEFGCLQMFVCVCASICDFYLAIFFLFAHFVLFWFDCFYFIINFFLDACSFSNES